jgi:hypothetical protein
MSNGFWGTPRPPRRLWPSEDRIKYLFGYWHVSSGRAREDHWLVGNPDFELGYDHALEDRAAYELARTADSQGAMNSDLGPV